MMKRHTAILAAMAKLAALALAAPVLAQSGMGMIGQRHVDGADRDSIPARAGEQYREIMICVENAPVAFQEIVVRYRNGSSHNIRLRQRIAAGRCSRVLGLGGRERYVQAVDFTYAPAADAPARPLVQVYAR